MGGSTAAGSSSGPSRNAVQTFTGPFRCLPYLDTLNTAHGIRQAQAAKKRAGTPLWNWTRQRGWQIVKAIMLEAGVPGGPHRSPKGLRHGFGINATVCGVPLNMLSKWMGHADIATTAIYADAMGPEEQDIASRMWS